MLSNNYTAKVSVLYVPLELLKETISLNYDHII